MKTKGKWIGLVVVALAVMLLAPASALAYEFKTDPNRAVIAADQVVEDDLMISSGSVVIDGTVKGDVFAAGGEVIINGTVEEDLWVTGGTVTVRGRVNDDLQVLGGTVIVDGEVGDNSMMMGGNINFGTTSKIGRDLLIGGGMVNMAGTVGRDVRAGCGTFDLSGTVGRNLEGQIDQLSIGSTAVIGQNVKYSAQQKGTISDTAQIGGAVDYQQITAPVKATPEKEDKEKSYGTAIFWWFIKTIALILLAIVILITTGKSTRDMLAVLDKEYGKSLGWGLIVLILTPIVSIILMITLIGYKIGMVAMGMYLLALVFAKVMVGTWLGDKILMGLSKKKDFSPMWSALVGITLIALLMAIPFLGWLIKLVVLALGMGAIAILGGRGVGKCRAGRGNGNGGRGRKKITTRKK